MTPTLARRLREAREAKGLTQEQVAAQIGTHRVQVGKWETGVATPRPHTLERLAELYGVSLEWLHGATDATERVARETPMPAAPMPEAYYRGVLDAAHRMSAETTAILYDARVAMERGEPLPAAPGGRALGAALVAQWDTVKALADAARERRSATPPASEHATSERDHRRVKGA